MMAQAGCRVMFIHALASSKQLCAKGLGRPFRGESVCPVCLCIMPSSTNGDIRQINADIGTVCKPIHAFDSSVGKLKLADMPGSEARDISRGPAGRL